MLYINRLEAKLREGPDGFGNSASLTPRARPPMTQATRERESARAGEREGERETNIELVASPSSEEMLYTQHISNAQPHVQRSRATAQRAGAPPLPPPSQHVQRQRSTKESKSSAPTSPSALMRSPRILNRPPGVPPLPGRLASPFSICGCVLCHVCHPTTLCCSVLQCVAVC